MLFDQLQLDLTQQQCLHPFNLNMNHKPFPLLKDLAYSLQIDSPEVPAKSLLKKRRQRQRLREQMKDQKISGDDLPKILVKDLLDACIKN